MKAKINYPAASSGVLEQRQLPIFMQLMVLVSLFLNVIANRVLIAMFADRGRKVTVGPKLAAPKVLLNDWAALEYFSCG